MPTRPPSLRAVAAFEAAARHESFGKAADELNLTHSAISHAIRGLELRLGAQLFARVGRTVTLTHEGANLAKRVRASLALLTDALEKRPELRRSRLSIGADLVIATRLLAPRLGAFRALHPEIDLELRSVVSAAALTAGEIDVAIRSNGGVDLGVSTRLIAQERLCPVAAPRLAHLQDLTQTPRHLLIESHEHPWSLWFAQSPRRLCEGAPSIQVDTDVLAIELARAGLGVSLARRLLVEADLAEGALVRLGEVEIPARSAYHLVWNPASTKHPEIALFLAWIGEALASPATLPSCVGWGEGRRNDAARDSLN
ncbi:LysR substrate-binding domain-containing protein [Phenylobacterium sp.]|uniref:LysR substrate-binding domain-containing protein n=1 Tax=Phenylobacterium sp. TaxID=1871053 RepID=UPI0025F89C0B|nr:LysR substrate-binding domain-containing protein [Phenylobacterium sp.]